jgi:hypothetical protein
MRSIKLSLEILSLALLGACAVPPPSGPGIMVLPGPGKGYAAFQEDDSTCRAAAAQSIGFASPAQAGDQAAIGSAAAGTVVGAAAGAAIGAASGNAGAGAAIGAGTGLLVGSAAGAANAQDSEAQLQQRYDMTYGQCMAAKGNKVPPLQPVGANNYPAPGGDYYYPYAAYPPPYAFYPGYGYLYPPVTVIYGFGWGGGGGWHGGGFPHGPHH